MQLTSRSRRTEKPEHLGGATVRISVYWNEKAKKWDVVGVMDEAGGRYVVLSARADSTVAMDVDALHELVTGTALRLEALLW